jgi:hypothetical protein
LACLILFDAASAATPPFQPRLIPSQFGRLTPKELASLKDGYAVTKTIPSDSTGASSAQSLPRVICLQRIASPPSVVLDSIMNFDSYPKKVSGVKSCSVYSVARPSTVSKAAGSATVCAKLVVGAPLLPSLEACYRHELAVDLPVDADAVARTLAGRDGEEKGKKGGKGNKGAGGAVTWTLDAGKPSDFEDVQGCWLVLPCKLEGEDAPATSSLVYYGIDAKLKLPIPPAIMRMVNGRAVKDATSWVKKDAEKVYEEKKKKGIDCSGAYKF